MLVDVLGRDLKAGDFVLYARRNSDKVLNYGIVVSAKSIFDGNNNYNFATDCYLITNFDDKEKLLYEDLYSKYAKKLQERQKKKQDMESKKLIIKANKPFHLYMNSNGYYLYLGKMKYNPEFLKDINYIYNNRTYTSYFSNNSNKEGHAYLKLYVPTNIKLQEILSNGEINLSDYLYSYNSYYGHYSLKLSHYGGYHNIELLKTFKSVHEDLGEFKLNGITTDNKIFAYELLHNKEVNPILDNTTSAYNVAHLCWLEFME